MRVDQPDELYSAAQSRAVDAEAISAHDLSGPVLMARAARAAFDLLLATTPNVALVQILCGPGNNGGDGFLLAMLVQARGISTRVFLVDGEPRSEDAAIAFARMRDSGVTPEVFTPAVLSDDGVVIDAMLGTGLRSDLREAYQAAIAAVNQLTAPVLALDVPSGIDSDTGCAGAIAIQAQWTISFITAKRGLFTAAGDVHAGERYLDDLDVPIAAFDVAKDSWRRLTLDPLRALVPGRTAVMHKGSFGRVLIVGGDMGMGGAVLLAAEAALRTGAGLVRVATRREHIAPLLARSPECMATAVRQRHDLKPLMDWADTVVIGPGLGAGPWGQQLLQVCLQGLDAQRQSVLFDADALNMLASHTHWQTPINSVITPHPGEAARLLDVSRDEVQRDRFNAAEQLSAKYETNVVLKGNGSLIVGNGYRGLCDAGNAGMATGGMGDVLSGVIGSLLAQGLDPLSAASLGTVLHSTAADAVQDRLGQAALLPRDVVAACGELLR